MIVKILKDAFDAGKKFRVIVVDSRPKSEGKYCMHQTGIITSLQFADDLKSTMQVKLSPLCVVGIHCLKQLLKHGIKCSYAQITSLAYLMKEVRCFDREIYNG